MTRPGRPTNIATSPQERTYADLHDEMTWIANGLTDLGVEQRDLIVHLCPRHPDVFAITGEVRRTELRGEEAE